MKWLSIQGTTILFNTDKQEWMKSRFYKEQIANAMNLNKLFKDMKVIEILTILGIKDIWRLESNI
jgi:hypothetical protein